MIHAVKTIPTYFEDAISGKKPFEVRNNDRDYREGDYIALNKYDPDKAPPEQYSGQSALFQITYVLDSPEYCKPGYVVLGLTPCIVGRVGISNIRDFAPGEAPVYTDSRTENASGTENPNGLKPCPFCGGNAVIVREQHRPTPKLCETEHRGEYVSVPRPVVNDGWLLECEQCGARGPHEYTDPVQSRERAATAWNERSGAKETEGAR